MSDRINRQWRLRSRPVGMISQSDFELVEESVGAPEEGQALVRCLMVAFEPAMRGWVNEGESYLPPVGIGEVMRASAVGQVVESASPEFEVGDLVTGMFGWQEYVMLGAGLPGMFGAGVKLPPGTTPEQALGVYGITGLTAYFGLLEIGKPEEGDVVVVSGAAGATGSVAAQIARIKGASKVVGIAGGPQKCRWLSETLGLDAAIDYKSQDVGQRMKVECPQGIDIFFDNVGGEILNSALVNMAQHGRIVLCGGISRYNEKEPSPGPSNYLELTVRRCKMEGFIVIDYFPRIAEAVAELAKWIGEGKIVVEADVQEGIENVPRTFLRLFEGKNLGKQLCKLSDISSSD